MKTYINLIKFSLNENLYYKNLYKKIEDFANTLIKNAYEYQLHDDYREGLIDTSKKIKDLCSKNKPILFDFKNAFKKLKYDVETFKISHWRKHSRNGFRGTFEFGVHRTIESLFNKLEETR